MQLKFYILSSEQETLGLAGKIAMHCAPGDCILLKGDLGTGKTTFARGFIKALCPHEQDIVSPTFTLVQAYQARQGWPIAHFDLYRLEDAREIEQIGFDEALQTAITLIEWPERAASHLPHSALTVELAYGATKEERVVTFSGDASVWKKRLESGL